MRCLLVTSIFAPINGGSAVVYEKLCKYGEPGSLVVLAPKYHCATGEALDGWQTHDKKANYPVHRINLLRPQLIQSTSLLHSIFLFFFVDFPLRVKLFFVVLTLIKKYDIKTICIGELNSLSWIGPWLKKVVDIKIINYIHGEEITTEATYRSYNRNRRAAINNADAIIAVSGFTRDYLINRFRVKPEKVILIANGVDLQDFFVSKGSQKLIDRYQISHKKVLTTVGRLVPRKGIDNVIKALPRTIKAIPDLHYVIVGIGPYENELKALTKEYKVEKHVTFAGRVPEEELAPHYQVADVFIMPNRTMPDGDTEGFGLVFLEANACGKPVIGGRAGGAIEAVKDGINGISVDGFNLDEISEAIIKMFSDEKYRNNLIDNGLKLAEDASFEHCALKFNKVCNSLSKNT